MTLEAFQNLFWPLYYTVYQMIGQGRPKLCNFPRIYFAVTWFQENLKAEISPAYFFLLTLKYLRL